MIDVRIIVPPLSLRWVTPAMMAERLGEDQMNEATLTLLGELIDEASEEAARLCGRPVARATYIERVPGWGTPLLRVDRRPIESVSALTFRGDPVPSDSYRIADARRGYIGRESDLSPNWHLTAPSGGLAERFPAGAVPRLDYAATYIAGYVMPGDDPIDGAEPFPATLRSKVIDAVRSNFFQRTNDPTLVSRTALAETAAGDTRTGAINLTFRSRGEAVAFDAAAQDFLRNWFR